jgi:hypothetical protein
MLVCHIHIETCVDGVMGAVLVFLGNTLTDKLLNGIPV